VKSYQLIVNDICKTYPSPAGDVDALKHVSFNVEKGDFIGVMGKSGAGKSTLVNMITGVDALTSGSIVIEGTPIHTLTEDQRNTWRGQHIGIVYQSFELLNQLSVLENITLAMDFCGKYHGIKSNDRALQLLQQVEIAEHAHKLPTAVSGGQQQRVAIARALANDAPWQMTQPSWWLTNPPVIWTARPARPLWTCFLLYRRTERPSLW